MAATLGRLSLARSASSGRLFERGLGFFDRRCHGHDPVEAGRTQGMHEAGPVAADNHVTAELAGGAGSHR